MGKLVIGLCDDEMIAIKKLKELVGSVLEEEKISADILSFNSGEKMLEKVNIMNAVFLDVHMPLGMSGLEAGKLIHKINKNCKIIIATKIEDSYKESFKINAFRFITKPFDREEIAEALQAVWNSQIGTEILELYNSRNLYWIMQREIVYIISYDSYSELFAGGLTFRKEISLSNLEKILEPKMFFRIHRQYIINMRWIHHYHNGVIWIADKRILVSRRKKKEFERAFVEYDLNYR